MARVVVTPQRLANPEIVGKPAPYIAGEGGHQGAARRRACSWRRSRAWAATIPLSIEKLSPVLAFYVVKDWHEGCERVLQLLRYGGTGHTMAIHSKDDAIIREFALQEAGLPHHRQHAVLDGRHRLHDRPGPLDEPGLRRLRRQHHLRQHHAAAPHQREAAGLRAARARRRAAAFARRGRIPRDGRGAAASRPPPLRPLAPPPPPAPAARLRGRGRRPARPAGGPDDPGHGARPSSPPPPATWPRAGTSWSRTG